MKKVFPLLLGLNFWCTPELCFLWSEKFFSRWTGIKNKKSLRSPNYLKIFLNSWKLNLINALRLLCRTLVSSALSQRSCMCGLTGFKGPRGSLVAPHKGRLYLWPRWPNHNAQLNLYLWHNICFLNWRHEWLNSNILCPWSKICIYI